MVKNREDYLFFQVHFGMALSKSTLREFVMDAAVMDAAAASSFPNMFLRVLPLSAALLVVVVLLDALPVLPSLFPIVLLLFSAAGVLVGWAGFVVFGVVVSGNLGWLMFVLGSFSALLELLFLISWITDCTIILNEVSTRIPGLSAINTLSPGNICSSMI